MINQLLDELYLSKNLIGRISISEDVIRIYTVRTVVLMMFESYMGRVNNTERSVRSQVIENYLMNNEKEIEQVLIHQIYNLMQKRKLINFDYWVFFYEISQLKQLEILGLSSYSKTKDLEVLFKSLKDISEIHGD